MKERYYRIDAIVRIETPDEAEFIGDVERVLDEFFDLDDLSVYEVVHMPTFAEQAREKVRRAWKNRS